MSAPTISYWRGRPITELSRDELIGALEETGRALDQARSMHRHTLDVWKAARDARAARCF